VIAAWGVIGAHQDRCAAVLEMLSGFDLLCLKKTKGGYPILPLYVASATEPTKYLGSIGGPALFSCVQPEASSETVGTPSSYEGAPFLPHKRPLKFFLSVFTGVCTAADQLVFKMPAKMGEISY
jgi:hypothetical protein